MVEKDTNMLNVDHDDLDSFLSRVTSTPSSDAVVDMTQISGSFSAMRVRRIVGKGQQYSPTTSSMVPDAVGRTLFREWWYARVTPIGIQERRTDAVTAWVW